MALPSSGTLTIQDIVNEFGGSAPHSLSEYYRGGSRVQNVPFNNGVPTSGAISISDFYGARKYTPLAILGSTTWKTDPTNSTTSSKSVSVPSGTRSVVIMGGIGTNGFRKTLHTGAFFGGSALTEVISRSNTPAEYTFDSAIYARNTTLTGTQTASMTYDNTQQVYGSGHIIIFLNKPFNSFTASSSGSVATTATTASVNVTKFGEGLQLSTGTVRAFTNLTNFSNTASVTLSSGSDARRSTYGFDISSGSYNSSASITVSLSSLANDFGETHAVATFAPTKFDEI